VKGTFVELAYW